MLMRSAVRPPRPRFREAFLQHPFCALSSPMISALDPRASRFLKGRTLARARTRRTASFAAFRGLITPNIGNIGADAAGTMALTPLGMSADSTLACAKGSSHDQALVARVVDRSCFTSARRPGLRGSSQLDRRRPGAVAGLRK